VSLTEFGIVSAVSFHSKLTWALNFWCTYLTATQSQPPTLFTFISRCLVGLILLIAQVQSFCTSTESTAESRSANNSTSQQPASKDNIAPFVQGRVRSAFRSSLVLLRTYLVSSLPVFPFPICSSYKIPIAKFSHCLGHAVDIRVIDGRWKDEINS